jgi:hypothetical protein
VVSSVPPGPLGQAWGSRDAGLKRALAAAAERTERGDGEVTYYVRKAPLRAVPRKVAFILSDPGLEELLSPLGMALTAALTGAEVHLYFQGHRRRSTCCTWDQ